MHAHHILHITRTYDALEPCACKYVRQVLRLPGRKFFYGSFFFRMCGRHRSRSRCRRRMCECVCVCFCYLRKIPISIATSTTQFGTIHVCQKQFKYTHTLLIILYTANIATNDVTVMRAKAESSLLLYTLAAIVLNQIKKTTKTRTKTDNWRWLAKFDRISCFRFDRQNRTLNIITIVRELLWTWVPTEAIPR